MILNITSIVIAVALVVVTFKYMRHTKRLADDTKRMADVMVKDYETRISPLIDIQVRRPSHSSQGFEIPITIWNLGTNPIRAKELVMKWWYKNHPEKGPKEIRKTFEVMLKRNDPVHDAFVFGDGQIKNSEIPESLALNGIHLGSIIAVGIWLEFFDINETVQRSEEKTLDPLSY